ncbi:MAG: hypothetical protein Q8906_13240 [Bacillota bacterium]|nr:hypothetical protein [Bacillota bacterium]
MSKPNFYYFFCNHWTQGGIGFAFPSGWYAGKKYERTFSTVYTIHKMLDAADDYPGLKVSMELDAYSYEEVEKEDPACIERLKQYISEGKAAVDGGTYGQPFGQDYGWEPNIRHLTFGRKSIKDVLNYDIRAFLVEEQWFHPQLPQLLLKSGFQYASLQNQNSGQAMPLNEAMISWKGIDGTEIPAIPANDLMVSCVRQYTGYREYKERLKDYNKPLLFQWVEIWPPGMDWGASATPFEKGIKHVEEWGGKSVTLQEYFDNELTGRELQSIYIPLDQSNYKNNWYQDGGWGYDGDKVIIVDQKVEQSLLAYETLSAFKNLKGSIVDNKEILNNLWKQFLILQNHDFSAARGYRAFTEDGIETKAGSYGIKKYQDIISSCSAEINSLYETKGENTSYLAVSNYNGVSSHQTIPFEIKKKHNNFVLINNGEKVPFVITEEKDQTIKGLMVIEVPTLGTTTVTIEETEKDMKDKKTQTEYGEDWIEDEHFKVNWKKGTWLIQITDKKSNETIDFTGFTGPIAKQNEHTSMYPALSSAHEIFTFAFDGTTHCPDQISLSRIKASVESRNGIESVLLLHCDLVTLHTTETPVAFAEARVFINHQTKEIKCQSYFYTGVNLSLNCHATFKHHLPHAVYYRDYPFGEEKTEIDDIYANTYMRVRSKHTGFTIIHPGVQKVKLERANESGKIIHLLARDKVFGEYTWTFSLNFNTHTPWESAKRSKAARANFPIVQNSEKEENEILHIDEERILLSAFYQEDDRYIVRIMNYSDEKITSAKMTFYHSFNKVGLVDFSGNTLKDITAQLSTNQTEIHLDLSPWEITTLAFS